MIRFAKASLLLALAFSSGCARAPDVRTEVDPSLDFGTLSTWAWLPVVTDEARIFGDVELAHGFRASIEQGLAERGYDRTDSAVPDFYVSTRVEVVREIDEYTESAASQTLNSLSHSPSYVVDSRETRYRIYERGTSAIEVADGREGRIVWRAVDRRRVRGSLARHVDAVAEALLGHFPPARDPGGATD